MEIRKALWLRLPLNYQGAGDVTQGEEGPGTTSGVLKEM